MRLLVIEDDDSIRANLERLLKLEGYQVLAAADGTDGARLALEHVPDLIICDLLMPGLDGYAVLSELRANPATSKIAFILLTASADQGERTRSAQHGVTVFLSKPFDQRELLEAVRRSLPQSGA